MNTISSTYCLLNCLFTCFFIKSQRLKYLAVTFYSGFINGALKNIALRTVNILLFVCLFIWSFSSHSRIFHSFGDVTITGEGLQMLTYARHFWPSSSEGSHLPWHGASVYNGHLRGHVVLTFWAECVAVELSLHVFTTYICRDWDSNTQPSACGVNAPTHCATAAAQIYWHR